MLDRRLQYFLVVAREGGFSRAADVLHIAQPALGRQVALLEAELGVRPELRPAPELAGAVAGGTLDLALVGCAGEGDGVERTVVRREALGNLVAADHPPAQGSDMVDLVALRDVPLSLLDRAATPGHDELLVGADRAARGRGDPGGRVRSRVGVSR